MSIVAKKNKQILFNLKFIYLNINFYLINWYDLSRQ